MQKKQLKYRILNFGSTILKELNFLFQLNQLTQDWYRHLVVTLEMKQICSLMILQMLSIMGSLPTMVKDMTGVDIKQKITASA